MNNINIRLLLSAVATAMVMALFAYTIPRAIWLMAWCIVVPPQALAVPLAAVFGTVALGYGLGLAYLVQRLAMGFVCIWKGEK